MTRYLILFFILIIYSSNNLHAQGSPDYKGGFKIGLDQDRPDKFLRVISWTQAQMNYNDDVPDDVSNTSFLLRRSRLLFIGQITKDFLTVFHIGLNSLNSQNMDPVGRGDGSQVFLHDAWVQYNLNENVSVGAGLHYFNGISRLSNQSTLNLMTLSNNRSSWATLGLSDQFARHLGVFSKGSFGKFQYQVAINNAITNSLDGRDPLSNQATYNGLDNLGSAESLYNYAGYFTYHALDEESNYLPYKIGTYLGSKKVLTFGTGFFAHPNGSVIQSQNGLSGEDAFIYAIDAFYDTPVGDKNAALTAYAVHQQNDYGENYLFGPYGSGSLTYGHLGYALPGKNDNLRFQGYIAYATHQFDASDDDRNIFKTGVNAYLSGHNSKLSFEFKYDDFQSGAQETISLQAMIYL